MAQESSLAKAAAAPGDTAPAFKADDEVRIKKAFEFRHDRLGQTRINTVMHGRILDVAGDKCTVRYCIGNEKVDVVRKVTDFEPYRKPA